MNILHVISSPAAGGAEVYVKDLSKSLAKRGHKVSIGFLESAKECGRDEGYEQEFLSDLDSAGIHYFFIGSAARKMPWLGLWCIRQYIKNNKIDVYHGHSTYGIVFGALLSIPRVYTQHSIVPRVSKRIYSCLRLFVDKQIGISTVCAKQLSEYSRREVTTINNGVDFSKLPDPVVKTKREDGIFHGICVGRISKPKNYPLLVEAISILPAEIKTRMHIKIVGEGTIEDTDTLQLQIDNMDLSNNIELLGNRSDIGNLLLHADLFIMSSASEGLPISLIEATAMGLPCVVTDVGGCRDIVGVCNNGILVPSDNPLELALAIEKIMFDVELMKQFSINAIDKSAMFSIEESCAQHLALYHDVLGVYKDGPVNL